MCCQLNLDGTRIEADGLACTIANSGHLGLPGLSHSPRVNMEDRLRDVIVIRKVDIDRLISTLLKSPVKTHTFDGFQHW